MPLQMPHVSVCDSHNELPQSKHCVLAVLEQGKPSACWEPLLVKWRYNEIIPAKLRSKTPSR